MTSTMEMLPAAPETSVDGESSSKRVLVAGAVAAVVALGAGGYFLLGSSSEDDVATGPVVTHQVKRTVKPATAVTKAVTKPAMVPATSTAHLGRDPFRALYVVPVTPAAGAAAPATTTTTTSSSGDSATASAPELGAEYALKLVSVTKTDGVQVYSFTVAGVTKKVIQGQRFGKYGELQVLAAGLSSNGKVVGALLQVGDDNPVEISVGEKISVQ
jgi:hypothetical protein